MIDAIVIILLGGVFSNAGWNAGIIARYLNKRRKRRQHGRAQRHTNLPGRPAGPAQLDIERAGFTPRAHYRSTRPGSIYGPRHIEPAEASERPVALADYAGPIPAALGDAELPCRPGASNEVGTSSAV